MAPRAEHLAASPGRTQGILLCVLAMVLFAIGNACVKVALETFSVPQTMALRAWTMMAFAAMLASMRGGLWRALAARRPLLQLARGGFLLADQFMFTLTLMFLGLTETSALYATAPLLTMALAAPILGERIGWRQWLAVLVAFLGALVIIRPGTSVFAPASPLALVGAVMYAFYSISTRLASHSDSNETSLLFTSFAGVIITTPFALAHWNEASPAQWLMLAGALGFSITAHMCVIRAYSLAPASVLQPFNYVSLAAATIIGVSVFGERLDALAIAGTIAIALSGLAVAWQEGRKAKALVE